MDLPRLDDLALARGARVLVRVDVNVPMHDGVIDDDLRLTTALPTIQWLRERHAVVVVAGHLGRPKGQPDARYSLAPVAARLGELLDRDVPLAPGIFGPRVEPVLASTPPGDVAVLENLRFAPGEESCDPGFCANLCGGYDAYVNEAFGASHRAHASIVGPPATLPHAAGLLLEREVAVLSRLLTGDDHPFVAVLGGVKVSDKLTVIDALLARCDLVLVGGAMAFTFLLAQGRTVGSSLVQPDMVDECRRLLDTGRVRIPTDLVIAREPSSDAETRVVPAGAIPDGWMGLDVGPATAMAYYDEVVGAAAVLWNGPMGMFEVPPFDAGTRTLADAVAHAPGFTVIGGGDSAAAIRQFGLADKVDHVSTGGGASLEFIERGDLPGLEALRNG
ncbi:MAG: phosphoglycerate kinase [Acidimicrobiia bacterium]